MVNSQSKGPHVLYGACWAADLEEVLFALEIAGIDPSLTGRRERSPIGNAAQQN